MAMLHIVNKSPFERNALSACLRMAKAGSSILLIEDAVYAAMKASSVASQVRDALGSVRMYVLAPDLQARGVGESQLMDGIQAVDYKGFVDLVTQHDNNQSWL